ncbi:hypothetical protein ACS0TY_020064 [Phlomoides rotata]
MDLDILASALVSIISFVSGNDMLFGLGSADGGQGLLRQAGHIGYDVMARNSVPCNQRGKSYYNCRGHQKANPYTGADPGFHSGVG